MSVLCCWTHSITKGYTPGYGRFKLHADCSPPKSGSAGELLEAEWVEVRSVHGDVYKSVLISVYHPHTDGLVEWLNKTSKSSAPHKCFWGGSNLRLG